MFIKKILKGIDWYFFAQIMCINILLVSIGASDIEIIAVLALFLLNTMRMIDKNTEWYSKGLKKGGEITREVWQAHFLNFVKKEKNDERNNDKTAD